MYTTVDKFYIIYTQDRYIFYMYIFICMLYTHISIPPFVKSLLIRIKSNGEEVFPVSGHGQLSCVTTGDNSLASRLPGWFSH